MFFHKAKLFLNLTMKYNVNTDQIQQYQAH